MRRASKSLPILVTWITKKRFISFCPFSLNNLFYVRRNHIDDYDCVFRKFIA